MVIILLVLSFFVLSNLIRKYENDMITEREVIKQKIIIRNSNINIEIGKSMKILKTTEEELNKIIKSNNVKLTKLHHKLQKQLMDYNPNISISLANTDELIGNLLISSCSGGENV
jgi:hypothetical protein